MGIEVLRLRQLCLAFPVGAAALTTVLVCALPRAAAQNMNLGNFYLLRPEVDGDPRNPPRFDNTAARSQTAVSRFGQTASGDDSSTSGAGTTGFDSKNRKQQKDKKGQKAKSKSGAQPALATPPTQTAPTTTPIVAQASAVAPIPLDPAFVAALQARTVARFSQNASQNPNQALTQNLNQAFSQNQSQQLRTVPPPNAANAAYPVPPLVDVVPVQMRRRTWPEEDAFAPVGVQAGAFTLRPALELIGAYDTNPARTVIGKPSLYSVVAPELLVNSNWTRHEVTASLRGSYTSYENASDLNRPSLDAKVDGRIDITPWTRADLEGRFILGTDNPGSPNLQAGLAKLPIFTTLGGSAGLGQRFNRFEFAVKGSADRTVYEESQLTDGTTSSNADRDFNRFAVETRASYELMPGVKPFVEGGVDRRDHDLIFDRNGLQRDSTGGYVRGGTSFEMSRILFGDASVGWIGRNYKDPTLQSISGVSFDSSITWVASALTAVHLTARTTIDESILAGVSGVFTREVGLQVDHAFRRWLIATLKYTIDFDDYVGSAREDQRHAVSALLTYKLTREWWLKAEYRREWRQSNEPGNGNHANVVLLGLRMQR